MVMPSGFTSRRLSPSGSSLKFVCSSAPATRRFFDEAKTTVLFPACTTTGEGNCHFAFVSGSSVRYQPPRFTWVGPGFVISIQSGVSPSASFSPPRLSAMNSEM